MRYVNYPGCSAATTGKAYSESFEYVASKVGIGLDEAPDWICCGASAAHVQSRDLGDAMPARSLANAEAAFDDEPVLALCAACYGNLKRTVAAARASEERREHMEELVGKHYEAKADVVNGIEPFLESDVQEQLKSQVTQPLNGLKVACYYGCLLVRPRTVTTFDDEENPQSMESVLALTGAEPIDWNRKTECCGASHHFSVPRDMKPLVDRILDDAVECGAEAIATACPLCNMNLDMREGEINKLRAQKGQPALHIPVYFFTQLIASAMGASDQEAALQRNFVPGAALLAEAKARTVERELTAEEKKAQRIAEAKKKAAARKAAQTEGADAAGSPETAPPGEGDGAVVQPDPAPHDAAQGKEAAHE